MTKILMKGNEAIAEAAIRGGCRYYFGYPITPQNEITSYMAKKLPEMDGVFLQAESEIGAINMVFGASGAGARVMTSSSGPGISLKQEGISYIAGAQLPCVIVNIMRVGPGLGGIQPSQGDYFQATKGGGHGDYKLIVFAPSTIQELIDITIDAFDIADKYRNPVMILSDGMLGQMMEPVELYEKPIKKIKKPWATTGWNGIGKKNLINSLYINPIEMEQVLLEVQKKHEIIKRNEIKYEEYNVEGAEIIVTAYGTTARIIKEVINECKLDMKIGLIRPIALWPFPYEIYREYARKNRIRAFLTVEMNMGQMVEDVKLGVDGKKPVYFYGRLGGIIPSPKEIIKKIESILGGEE